MLSHIECAEDSSYVNLHLLVQGVPDDETPGLMTIEYNTPTQIATVSPDGKSGGVWHYNFYLPSGYYDVTWAVVDDTYFLHNPSSYAQDYNCGSTLPTSTPTGEPSTPTPDYKLTPTGEPSTPTPTSTPASTLTSTPTNTPTSTSTPGPTPTETQAPTSLTPGFEPVPTDGPTVPTWIWLPLIQK